jgi:hypothetical protein
VNVGYPLRCSRCHAYANCYFRFDGNKNTAICNICTMNFNIEQSAVEKCNINSSEVMTEGVVDYVIHDKSTLKKSPNLIKVIIAIEIHSFIV